MLTSDQIATVISRIIDREGDTFTDDPADKGGATRFGVTQSSWDAYRAANPASAAMLPISVKFLQRDDAARFYLDYLSQPKITQIPDLPTFDLVADCAVNHGVRRAVEWLQQALGVDDDGVIGAKTLTAIQHLAQADASNSMMGGQKSSVWIDIYTRIIAHRIRYYGAIVISDALQLRFLRGWLDRATDFLLSHPY